MRKIAANDPLKIEFWGVPKYKKIYFAYCQQNRHHKINKLDRTLDNKSLKHHHIVGYRKEYVGTKDRVDFCLSTVFSDEKFMDIQDCIDIDEK